MKSSTPARGAKPRTGARAAVAPKAEPLHPRHILVPVDFSEASADALAYAVSLARQFNAKITLLHAIEPLPYPIDMTYAPMGYAPVGRGFPIEPTMSRLDELAARAVSPKMLADTVVHIGRAYDIITTTAKEIGADLIVIATHGNTGLKHALLGSTTERVVRHATCPVLVVRAVDHNRK